MIKLSVIIPIYNAEKTLKRCIDSILKQKFKDYEIILVDDNSTDSSLAICQDYVEKYPNILLIQNKNSKGVSSARNKGLSKARGEFVTFVDADDYIEDYCYEKANNISEDKELIIYHYVYENEEDKKRCKIYNKNLHRLKAEPDNFNLIYAKSNGKMEGDTFIDDSISIFIWRLWIKKDYLDKYGVKFHEGIRISEDRIFLQNLLLNNPKIEISDDNFGYIHTVSKGGTSLTDTKDLKIYIPWLFEQSKNLTNAEYEVCSRNKKFDRDRLKNLKYGRAFGMRTQLIINEFKNNRENARLKIEEYRKDEFFKWAYNWENFIYTIKNGDKKEILRFLLVKFKCYFILEKIYSK